MSKRSKAIAKLDRERKAAEREKELQAGANKLKRLQGGFSRTPIPKTAKLQRTPSFNIRYDPTYGAVEQNAGAHVVAHKQVPEYSEDMLLREEKAKEQTRQLKARVGFVGNKMGLQYLTDADLEDERKGLLRRRS